MITVTANPNMGTESHFLAVGAQIADAGRRYENKAGELFTAAARLAKADLTATFKSVMDTIYDGKVVLTVTGAAQGALVNFEFIAAVKAESLDFDTRAFDAALSAAVAAKKAEPIKVEATVFPVHAVDLKKIVGTRTGDVMNFSMSAPTFAMRNWNLVAGVADVATDEGRKAVVNRMLASIKMWLNTNRLQASFGDQEAGFGLPVIQVVAEKKVVPRAPANWNFESAKAPAQPASAHIPTVVAAQETTIAAKSGQDELFDIRLLPAVSAAVNGFVQAKLGGNDIKITAVDFSDVSFEGNKVVGTAGAKGTFFGATGTTPFEVDVPLDQFGNPVVAEIARTESDVKAESDRVEALRIMSQDESAKQLNKYLGDQVAKASFLKAAVPAEIEAGYRESLMNQMTNMPILKAVLPEEFSKEGNVIKMGGNFYRLHATTYDSPDAERGCHWLLKLEPGLTEKDACFIYNPYL